MRIARGLHNSNTTADQQCKFFYLLPIPGQSDCWKFGETYNISDRVRQYNQLMIEPMDGFDHQWTVPDWLRDTAIHPALMAVAERLEGRGCSKNRKEIFRGELEDIVAAINSAVDKAWEQDEWRNGELSSVQDGTPLALSDLDQLDNSEWVDVEMSNPLSEELVDHVLKRFIETA